MPEPLHPLAPPPEDDRRPRFVFPPPPPPSRRLPWVHIILFMATVGTTLLAGALQQGVNPFTHPEQIVQGLPFSLTLLAILLCHEMGHYLVSRWHRLDVTLPYFIPAPPIPFLIGTLGAFIRIRSPIHDKPALLDIGVSGPLVGVVVSLPLLAIGLHLSDIQPLVVGEDLPGIILGESLLFKLMALLVVGPLPAEQQIIMHPMAFAGWIGLLVTNLNLIPIGQLDGGHVSYALFGRRSRLVSRLFFVFLIICGILGWSGWLVWAALLYFMGHVHPPPLHDWLPLDRRRRLLGFLTIAVFGLTFTPVPFQGF